MRLDDRGDSAGFIEVSSAAAIDFAITPRALEMSGAVSTGGRSNVIGRPLRTGTSRSMQRARFAGVSIRKLRSGRVVLPSEAMAAEIDKDRENLGCRLGIRGNAKRERLQVIEP